MSRDMYRYLGDVHTHTECTVCHGVGVEYVECSWSKDSAL